MADSSTVLAFPLLSRKPVELDFSGGDLSSDGGLLLLAQLDRQVGLTERVAGCIRDSRLPERVRHSLVELIRQRVYQIAAGNEDWNDADRLRRDPALKAAVRRAPKSGADLASQPTPSRLENSVVEVECEAINGVLPEQFLACPRKPPREVVLDFDTIEGPRRQGTRRAAGVRLLQQPLRLLLLPAAVRLRPSAESEGRAPRQC